MKNRTSLTLVISLLVCTLTAGTFAQTLPPEDSTLEARPSDLQSSAQAENANGQCAYRVTPNDKVYLQINNVKLRSDDLPQVNNLPLDPYFYVYGKSGEDWKYISGTSSQAGKQVCEKVPYPSRFQFYIDNTYQECFINVYSDYGNRLVARGVKINVNPLLNWAKNPNRKANDTFKLDISNGNTIDLKFDYVTKNRYYYFEIVSYAITSINRPKVKFNDKEYLPDSVVTNAKSVQTLSFNSKESEFLATCRPNRVYTFPIVNDQGIIDTIKLPTNEIVKQLNECMKKYPKDYKKWVVKCVSKHNSELELGFSGIRRVYGVTTVNFPRIHGKHEYDRYAEKGYSPWLRVYVRKNGIPCGINSNYAKSGQRSWNCDFPEGKDNRFVIREGIKARYSIQICDADTWMYEISLVEITGIKDLDFTKGIISEKPATEYETEEKLAKIYFEEIEE